MGSIANRIGKGSSTTWVYGGSGNGYFDVTADAAWTLKATAELPPVGDPPITYKGTTDQVTSAFNSAGNLTVSWVYTGPGNFIVNLDDTLDGSQADTIANVIGRSSDSTQLFNDIGVFALDVTADGPWAISVTVSQ